MSNIMGITIAPTQAEAVSFWSLSPLTIIFTIMRILLILGELTGMMMVLYGGIRGFYLRYVKKDLVMSNKLFKIALRGTFVILLVLIVWFGLTYIRSIHELKPCTPGKTCP